jgi:formamidopyrimidine-DNA glycosylase
MPELPEVETMRRGILHAVGATVVAAKKLPCTRRPIDIKPRIDRLNKRIAGEKIEAVDRLGKRVVIRFGSGDRLIFEPRMTGLVLVHEAPTTDHLRFALELKGCRDRRILFWDRRGLGKVILLSDREYQAKLTDGSLGPDALSVSAEELASRYQGSRREIKVALLDQSKVLGVGNLYASEILHLAGVHPQTRCDRISKKRWQAIHAFMREVLNTAIEYEGSTLSDGTYRNTLNAEGGYQNEHRVYDREGEACSLCQSAKILRIVQAQRSTFFCKRCQTKR